MTDAPPPLPSDLVDELLSAELDDDFDAAAHDLGLDPADARDRLAATPDIDARRAALAAARDALTELPDYDELLAARLRAKATNAAVGVQRGLASERERRRNRWLLAVGSVAAAIIVVAGLATLLNGSGLNGSGSQSANSSSRDVAAPAPATLPPGLPSLGTAHDVKTLADTLRLTVDSRVAFGSASGTDSAQSLQNGLREMPAHGSVPLPSATVPSACRSQARAFAGLTASAAPFQVGAATVAGKPALVEIFRRTGNGAAPDRDILVVMDADCALLLQQTWPVAP